MDVLITGGGGREHALAWKIKQSPKVKNVFVAPGNAGTALIAQNVPATTTEEIITWLKNNAVDLVIVGPDSHLADGIVDKLEKLGIAVFGPTKAAAEIEWSKSFAKKFMKDESSFVDFIRMFHHAGSQADFVDFAHSCLRYCGSVNLLPLATVSYICGAAREHEN